MVKKKEKVDSGHVFVGVFFIGLAIGFLTGHIVPGALFGLGFGFLAQFIVKNLMTKKEK